MVISLASPITSIGASLLALGLGVGLTLTSCENTRLTASLEEEKGAREDCVRDSGKLEQTIESMSRAIRANSKLAREEKEKAHTRVLNILESQPGTSSIGDLSNPQDIGIWQCELWPESVSCRR